MEHEPIKYPHDEEFEEGEVRINVEIKSFLFKKKLR